jgi:hypothetical protein
MRCYGADPKLQEADFKIANSKLFVANAMQAGVTHSCTCGWV